MSETLPMQHAYKDQLRQIIMGNGELRETLWSLDRVVLCKKATMRSARKVLM
jgi:hypothetical protein